MQAFAGVYLTVKATILTLDLVVVILVDPNFSAKFSSFSPVCNVVMIDLIFLNFNFCIHTFRRLCFAPLYS